MEVTYRHINDEEEALAPGLCTELVPLQIAYTTGFNRERALRSVDFFYETAHNEPSCRYVAGFGIGSQQRLTRIESRVLESSKEQIARAGESAGLRDRLARLEARLSDL